MYILYKPLIQMTFFKSRKEEGGVFWTVFQKKKNYSQELTSSAKQCFIK